MSWDESRWIVKQIKKAADNQIDGYNQGYSDGTKDGYNAGYTTAVKNKQLKTDVAITKFLDDGEKFIIPDGSGLYAVAVFDNIDINNYNGATIICTRLYSESNFAFGIFDLHENKFKIVSDAFPHNDTGSGFSTRNTSYYSYDTEYIKSRTGKSGGSLITFFFKTHQNRLYCCVEETAETAYYVGEFKAIFM